MGIGSQSTSDDQRLVKMFYVILHLSIDLGPDVLRALSAYSFTGDIIMIYV